MSWEVVYQKDGWLIVDQMTNNFWGKSWKFMTNDPLTLQVTKTHLVENTSMLYWLMDHKIPSNEGKWSSSFVFFEFPNEETKTAFVLMYG